MRRIRRKADPPDLKPGQFCYYVLEDQDPKEHGGFVPSLVIEHRSGHRPMVGGAGQAPWVWGATLQEAREIAAAYNEEELNLTPRRVTEIVASSMASMVP